MKILVTGAAGFIGSNFIEHIFDNTDFEIVALDCLNYRGNLENFPPRVWTSPRFRFVYGDICNEILMLKMLKDVDYVVNFAAWSFVDRSMENSQDFVRSDVEGVRCLMEALRNSDSVRRFIHISSSEVYGTNTSIGLGGMRETHQLDPKSIYAAAKCGGDRLARAYYLTHNLPLVIIRPFNNYGPRQFVENLIPRTISNIFTGKTIPIFGSGFAKRDWLHVRDTCRGLMMAITHGKIGEVYNLCTGVATSTSDIVKNIIGITDEYPEPFTAVIEHLQARPGEVEEHRGSCDKARMELGWTPTIDLMTGLEKTVDWFYQNMGWWNTRYMHI